MQELHRYTMLQLGDVTAVEGRSIGILRNSMCTEAELTAQRSQSSCQESPPSPASPTYAELRQILTTTPERIFTLQLGVLDYYLHYERRQQ